MSPINTNNPERFKAHAADYGAVWVDADQIKGAPANAVGALVKPDGSILHWIKQI